VTPALADHEGRLLRCHNPVPVAEEVTAPTWRDRARPRFHSIRTTCCWVLRPVRL